MPHKRCAIYTRKSSEEGLEQDFNSLDAQREACAAFIQSQVSQGWALHPERYDDGGYSGGSMQRPALKQLLSDIGAGRIDIVVVYKVDRLTRALPDFAKMVEIFDAQGVSFVSVTQQFNTTTSMGRLTLNVLLSFAQFEREVTGERIRDKIAASKQKGLWMGGLEPLGYRAKGRTLEIKPKEAQTVRTLYQLYLEHDCVRQLKAAADGQGLSSRKRQRRDGTTTGGIPFATGHLYAILKNPLYIGLMPHKGKTYPGAHPPIIDQATWDQVQAKLAANRKARREGKTAKHPSMLAGLLFDADGKPLTPSHAVKQGKRYRYYIAQHLTKGIGPGWRLPAGQVEAAVQTALRTLFKERGWMDVLGQGADADALKHAITKSDEMAKTLKSETMRKLLLDLNAHIRLTNKALKLEVEAAKLADTLGLACPNEDQHITTALPMEWVQRGVETKLVITANTAKKSAAPDPALIKTIVRANDWWQQLTSSNAKSLNDIARREKVSAPYIRRLLPLALLAPDIIEAILAGQQPIDLTAEKLSRIDMPTDWGHQRQLLGFKSA